MGAFSKILILLALALIGGAGWFLYGRPAPDNATTPTVQVRVAAQPLIVGTFLDDGKAPLVAVPETEADPGWVTDAQPDLIGAVIIAPVPAGEKVPRSALLRPGQDGFLAAVLEPGMRAVSLAVDAVSGNAGHIFPGDRVDLLLTQQISSDGGGEADPARRWASETILRNVRVIAVDQRLGGDLSQRALQGEATASVARTITLEVAPEGAETIAVARNIGAISLTLRSLLVEDAAGHPAETGSGTDAPRPTWAGDVSAATRSASGRPEIQPAVDAPPPPAVRVMRGGVQEVVSQ